MGDNEVLFCFCDDDVNSFFIYQLSPAWAKYFCMFKKYKGQHVSISCLPMELALSVGIIQDIQRGLGECQIWA